MKVLIVEDEVPAVRRLQKLLVETDPAVTILASLDSVAAAVDWFSKNLPPDLVCMDIQLSDGQCFEIFEKAKVECPVIFITAYDEYAIQAFKVNSIDYLLKPIDASQLSRSLEKLRKLASKNVPQAHGFDMQALLQTLKEQHPSYRSRFLATVKDKFVSIPADQIFYFTTEHKLTYFITREGKKYLIDSPLDKLEGELNPRQFFRANRQFIVSLHAIAGIHTYFNGKLKIYLRGTDMEIVISRVKANAFKQWLNK